MTGSGTRYCENNGAGGPVRFSTCLSTHLENVAIGDGRLIISNDHDSGHPTWQLTCGCCSCAIIKSMHTVRKIANFLGFKNLELPYNKGGCLTFELTLKCRATLQCSLQRNFQLLISSKLGGKFKVKHVNLLFNLVVTTGFPNICNQRKIGRNLTVCDGTPGTVSAGASITNQREIQNQSFFSKSSYFIWNFQNRSFQSHFWICDDKCEGVKFTYCGFLVSRTSESIVDCQFSRKETAKPQKKEKMPESNKRKDSQKQH